MPSDLPEVLLFVLLEVLREVLAVACAAELATGMAVDPADDLAGDLDVECRAAPLAGPWAAPVVADARGDLGRDFCLEGGLRFADFFIPSQHVFRHATWHAKNNRGCSPLFGLQPPCSRNTPQRLLTNALKNNNFFGLSAFRVFPLPAGLISLSGRQSDQLAYFRRRDTARS
ncbi:MAG: hypothetical protein KDJ37_13980 [Hyphomicrobiaceae bacterium]|nr:hypothetical protein [Hyphomicrobiaceae bacterium]